MVDLNPYIYNSVDYLKKEKELANWKLYLVIAGATKAISAGEFTDEEVISACEAIVIANSEYKNTVKRYEEAIAREENKNE